MAKVQAELVEHDERLGAHDERLGTHDEQLGAHGQLLARILGELDSVAPGARARLLRSGERGCAMLLLTQCCCRH